MCTNSSNPAKNSNFSSSYTSAHVWQPFKKKYNLVSRALKNNSDIEIEYKNKTKVINPHNFSFYKEYIYITGYSKTDKDLRTYNLAEIKIK